MPNFQFDKFLGVIIRSQPRPLEGQEHRSSDNYDFGQLRKGSKLKWICADGISFDVKLDVKGGVDPVVFKGVCNGTETGFPNDTYGLYIADPHNAVSNFEIQVRVL